VRTRPLALLAGSIAVSALAAGVSGHSPQAPAADQVLTLRAETTLVEFTIVATDGRGRPVTDLKADDISILEDGKPRPVAFFRFEGATGGEAGGDGTAPAAPAKRDPLPAGIFTNRAEYSPGPPRHLTAVVFDAINTPPDAQATVTAQVVRYLKGIPPDSRLGLYRLGQQTAVLHDFTQDADALRARLAKDSVQAEMLKDDQGGDFAGLSQATTADRARAMNQAAESEARMLAGRTDALREERLSATLAGLEALGNHLAGVPGRKNLVWISHGMPTVAFTGGFINRSDERIRKTAERLASQGITIYAVDARGLEPPDMQTSNLASRSSHGGSAPRPPPLNARSIAEGRHRASMEILADLTGGRLVMFTNDPSEGVNAAAEDIRGSYSTGFYATRDPDDRWHRLQVKVSRRGVTVRHRQGYVASATEADYSPDWTADRWRSVGFAPLGSTAIRFDARCEFQAGTLQVLLQVTGADVTFRRADRQLVADVDVGLAEKTATGPVRVGHEPAELKFPDDPRNDPRSALVRFVKTWPVNANTSAVRLIVRDRTSGRYGTVDVSLAGLATRHP
jgi:VWFA-related protein